jgi:pilus assembly protein CpaE
MPASTILVLSADAASMEIINGALTAVGYAVTPETDAARALRSAPDHQLIVLDVIEGDRSPAEICREIRTTPSLSAIPVLCVAQSDSVEERIAFLEAGADDVMARPFDARELEARVEALLVRFQRSRDLRPDDGTGATPARRNRTVAVFSPKGGVGGTTIATNVGVVEALRRPDKVVLIDADVQFGQVATHLNLEVHQSLAELARDETALREPEIMRTYALRHDSGLHVLAAPPGPQLAALVEPRHLGLLLEAVVGSYDSVVVDCGSTLDERTMTVLDRADVIVLPVHPEMAALKAVRSLIDYFQEIGSLADKAAYVVNNMFAREILRLRDIENALGAHVTAELPYDAFLYLKAVNEGVPIVIGAPRSAPAQRLSRLTDSIFGAQPVATPEPGAVAKPAEPRRQRGLAGSLRRG